MNIFRKKRRNQFKKIKYKRFILLIFFLIMTTFAWFVYYKILDTGIEGHITSWNVNFIQNDKIIGNTASLNFNNLYPGMQEEITTIKIKNNGDAITKINYSIKEIYILGKKYEIVKEKPINNDLYLIEEEPIIDENKKKIYNLVNDKNRFPFRIVIENTDELLAGEEGFISIKINWIADNDILDTKWGYDVAKYFEQYPMEKNIVKIKIKVNAYQIPKSDYTNNNI